MTRHGADDNRPPLLLNATETFDERKIDEGRRLRQPQLHHRQERVTACQKLCFRIAAQQARRLANRGGTMESEVVHRSLLELRSLTRLSALERRPHRLSSCRHA